MMNINPLLLIDGYKCDHRRQYPEGTEFVYSNFTARKSRISKAESIVFFGLQYFMKEYLIKQWNLGFFSRPKEAVVREYKRILDSYLGKDMIPMDHIEALHDLGYLPLKIKAVPEGTLVPIGVPCLTIINTVPKFFWLTNYLETVLSNIIWKPITSATIANEYRKTFDIYSKRTGYDPNAIQFQAHDFSYRGMSGLEDAMMSGAGHLLSFTGTDSIPAVAFLEQYYFADVEKELVGCSVAATEHSVMCMSTKESEFETFKRLITELYPTGIVSIVSDTWDLWTVLTDYLPRLKEEILARDGRVVIRPDSGNPVDIICGMQGYTEIEGRENFFGDVGDIVKWRGDFYKVELRDGEEWFELLKKQPTESEITGAYELLWNTFGGTVNEKGFKELNPKVGLIYGDSITLDRQVDILHRLQIKGFSASNLVLGVGSYTYEYVTRDTFGFAMKATWGQVNGEARDIFKDPITDNGTKKSAKGLLMVYEDEDFDSTNLKLRDQCTKEEEEVGVLQTVFEDGELMVTHTLDEIRKRLAISR